MNFENYNIIGFSEKPESILVDFKPSDGIPLIRKTKNFSYVERSQILFKSIFTTLGVLFCFENAKTLKDSLSQVYYGYEFDDEKITKVKDLLERTSLLKTAIKEPTKEIKYVNNFDNVEFISNAIRAIYTHDTLDDEDKIKLDEILNDPLFMLKAIGEEPSFIRFASAKLKADSKFMLSALDKSIYTESQRNEFLKHLPSTLKNDSEFMKTISEKIKLAVDEKAEVVIVGGGPVGLSTAIRIKLKDPSANIVLFDKTPYTENENKDVNYKRRNQPLHIDPTLLFQGLPDADSTDSENHAYYDLVTQFKNNPGKAVPTQDIENGLKELAEKLRIDIRIQRVDNAKELPNQFPHARQFIGAGGAYGVIRQQIFGDKFSDKVDLQYITQLKIKAQGTHFGKIQMSSVKTEIGALTQINDGKDGTAIRIFIDETTYQELEKSAAGGRFINFKSLLNETLAEQFKTILKAKNITLDGSEEITAIRIGHYVSEKSFLEKRGVKWALVGDEVMGTPFFTSLSNGIKGSEALSNVVVGELEYQRPHIYGERVEWYKHYSTFINKLSKVQIPTANAKSFFVSIAKKFFSIANIFYRTITLQIFDKSVESATQSFKLIASKSSEFSLVRANSNTGLTREESRVLDN